MWKYNKKPEAVFVKDHTRSWSTEINEKAPTFLQGLSYISDMTLYSYSIALTSLSLIIPGIKNAGDRKAKYASVTENAQSKLINL